MLNLLFLIALTAPLTFSTETPYPEGLRIPSKAKKHMKCFLNHHMHRTFQTKRSTLGTRCNSIESGTTQVSVNNPSYAVIVDYTKSSRKKRFFILDLADHQSWAVKSLYVSHGRYGETRRDNRTPRENGNTIRKAHLFSNEKGSNASSNGFYITGHRYRGRWSGPDGQRNSLVLHGIEKDQTDNACDRAIVIHGNAYIRETAPNKGVRRMSSGCYMLDYNIVNEIVDLLRGSGGPQFPNENKAGGIPFLSYGPREAQLADDYYCGNSWF